VRIVLTMFCADRRGIVSDTNISMRCPRFLDLLSLKCTLVEVEVPESRWYFWSVVPTLSGWRLGRVGVLCHVLLSPFHSIRMGVLLDCGDHSVYCALTLPIASSGFYVYLCQILPRSANTVYALNV
jgi:hypothetical protein